MLRYGNIEKDLHKAKIIIKLRLPTDPKKSRIVDVFSVEIWNCPNKISMVISIYLLKR